jgi:hypothetical protein
VCTPSGPCGGALTTTLAGLLVLGVERGWRRAARTEGGPTLVPSIALVAGRALLAWAADQLVLGAARLALSLRVSAVLVGAVVIGLGTSAPEILISALGAAEGSVDIAAGNVVGSNIANVASSPPSPLSLHPYARPRKRSAEKRRCRCSRWSGSPSRCRPA